jgi:translation elongation factor EF-G
MTGHALLSLVITPQTKADQERLARGVGTLMAEDPTMSAKTDPATGEVVIGGMGELHLEIIVDRLKREFNVEATLGKPQIAYKETLTRPPVLLEPIMRVEVAAPKEYMGDVMANLASRRGQPQSQEDRGGTQIIFAQVPLAEMFGFATDLRSRTRGRGTFAMQFAHYQPFDPAENQGAADDSMVGAPRGPKPTPRDSSAALPEPMGDDLPH